MQWAKEIIIIAFIIQLLINQVVKLVLYGSNCPCHGIVDTTWSMTWKKGLNTVAGMPNYWTLKRKDKKDNLSFFNDCFIMFERNGTLFTVMFGIPTVQGQIQNLIIEPPSPKEKKPVYLRIFQSNLRKNLFLCIFCFYLSLIQPNQSQFH